MPSVCTANDILAHVLRNLTWRSSLESARHRKGPAAVCLKSPQFISRFIYIFLTSLHVNLLCIRFMFLLSSQLCSASGSVIVRPLIGNFVSLLSPTTTTTTSVIEITEWPEYPTLLLLYCCSSVTATEFSYLLVGLFLARRVSRYLAALLHGNLDARLPQQKSCCLISSSTR